MSTLIHMKTYTNLLKILTSVFLVLAVTGCAYFTAPKFDTNELLLIADLKTEIDYARSECAAIATREGSINLAPTKKSFSRLNNYAKQTAHNEDYVKMLTAVNQLLTELEQRNGKMSKIYCDMKTKDIRTAVDIIGQGSSNKF